MPTYHDDIFGNDNKRIRQSLQRAFAKVQLQVTTLLPDSCKIRPASGNNIVMSIKGVQSSDAPIYRTYRGFDVIPCRADDVRSYRPDALEAQPSQVDEIDLHLPVDMVILESDVVELNGYEYKIHKLSNDSAFLATQVAKLMRLGDSLD